VVLNGKTQLALVEKIARPATSVTVPAREGSYLIKAVDKLGNFSSNEAIISNTIVSDFNLLLHKQNPLHLQELKLMFMLMRIILYD
jgi:hypothetical protein